MTTSSATERVKLWNQFGTCVDHETVKTDFLRRVHRKNPPFRFKLKPKLRNCAEIPPMVEFHYKNPPPLLPSLRDVLRCERVYHEHGLPSTINTQIISDQVNEDLNELQKANEKVRQFEQSINLDRQMHNEIANETEINIANDEKVEMNGLTSEKKGMSEMELIENIVETTPMQSDEKIIEKIENSQALVEPIAANGVTVKSTEFELNNSNAAQDSNDSTKLKTNHRKRKRNTSTKTFGTECDDLLELSEEVFKSKLLNSTNGPLSTEAIDVQLNGLDIDIIKHLALVQLQQILKDSPELVTKYQHENANIAIKDALKAKPIKITLPSQLLSKDDIAKIAEQFTTNSSAADDCVVNDMAYAGIGHPIQPLPQLNKQHICYRNGFESICDDRERALAIAKRLEKPLRQSKVRARAVLTPVGDILAGKQWYTNTTADDSIFMRYRSLVIGSGAGCDLQIKNFDCCARLSPHHATIFYDEVIETEFFFSYLSALQ